jgi:hypothetical protein
VAIILLALAAVAAPAVGLAACSSGASASAGTPVAAEQTAVYVDAAKVLTLSGKSIRVVDSNRGGVLATDKAEVKLDGVHVVTLGSDCIGLATAAQGGSITATGCDVMTSGRGSPCLYSRDLIAVTGGVYEAINSEATIVETGGSVTLTNAALTSKYQKYGIRLTSPPPPPQAAATTGAPAGATTTIATAAASGAPDTKPASFSMSGGSLVYLDRGAVFYVAGCTGMIELNGVKITVLSDLLLKAEGMQAEPAAIGDGQTATTAQAGAQTGSTVKTGAHAVLRADRQTLAGEIDADSSSVVELSLNDQSSLVGSIDPKDKAKEIDLTLDAGSTWRVTADSHVSGLSLAAGVTGQTITSITGNGHTVYYDPNAGLSFALGGKTYKLNGGGYLKPAEL